MDFKFKQALATGAAITALLLNPVSLVFASSDATATVAEDGTATTYTNDGDNFTVVNNNGGAGVANLDLGVGVSGLNDQSGNDDENSLGTGPADGFGDSDNFLNTNVTEANSSVGEDGDADATAYDNDVVTVRNTNTGDIDNMTLGLALSGFNTQSDNDDGNQLTTGDSTAMAAALNEVNSNWTTVGGSNSAHATASVGEDGTATTFAQDNDVLVARNTNTAVVDNLSVAVAVSGWNDQSGNDDDNSLATGSSTADSSANNFANTNVTVVEGGDGGSATADSSVGEDGDADATAYDNDTATVTNTNDASIDNVSAGVAVSGGNTQSGNDDGNTMTTGSSSGSSCSTNTANSNWTAIGGTLPEGGTSGCN